MGDRKEKKDSWAQDGRDRKRREGRGERQWSGTAGAEEECITGPAWEQKTLLIYNYFDTGYYCLDECLHVCYHWFLCVCVWCPWYVWLFSQSLSLYLCICFCESACVPAFAFVCACTYWQGFKETFSLHLSLICPAEYRELFTLQNQGSLGGFAALKVSLGSGHTCVQKKNIGLQGEIGLALHSSQCSIFYVLSGCTF